VGRNDILIVAVNARYSHCAFAARSLLANLGPLAGRARILETDLDVTPMQLAAQIVEARPRIAGFSVYLWNIRLVEAAARILRVAAPGLRLAAGGPELTADYPNAALFDAVILGEGESAFRAFCERTLNDTDALFSHVMTCEKDKSTDIPFSHVMTCEKGEDPETLALPYDLYTDADLAQRTVYVEASRGCPCACAYCTSARTGLRLIPLDRLLPALDALWRRGLRRFKFLDRSFNAPAGHACAVLDFFLGRVTPETRLHFEINPDHLHDAVAGRIAAFPAATLHLEAGVQTLNPRVAAAVGRSPDTRRTLANLRFLTHETGATAHADLIFGLPGEDEASFAHGFNTLVAECDPPEVQVNLLKGLPGTRLARDAAALNLAFSPEPPYELLRSDAMDFETLTRLGHFARCWELVHNRGHFPQEVQALQVSNGGDFYGTYQALADRIRAAEGKLFAIARPRLAALLRDFLTSQASVRIRANP
jgi:radical SAM superfamily enzyme YgiQ (UPF0313 family)